MKSSSTAYAFDNGLSTEEKQRKLQVIKTENKRVREKRAFALKFSAYLVVIIMLMVTTVFSRLVLTETRVNINTSSKNLTELKSENAYLSYKLESLVSLRNAEQYAVSELGLVKMDSSRIEYVNLQNSNEIATNQDDTTFSEDFDTFFNAVIDFFAG